MTDRGGGLVSPAPGRSQPLWKRLAWFVGLWFAGVAVVGVAAYLIRQALGA